MDYSIILTTTLFVCLFSFLGIILLKRFWKTSTSCLIVAAFGAITDLTLLFLLTYALLTDFEYYRYPTTVSVLQCLFIEGFVAGILVWCLSLKYDPYDIDYLPKQEKL